MVTLIFLSVIVAVFVAVVALEGGDPLLERRPRGLLTWIVSGNWPAKIGGALMVVGVGALLRYAAINFDVPAVLKLTLGIAATAALGFGSFLTAHNTQRRVISLALGGAAFGVAYLTAYSAFALFGYLPTLQGLGLLVLTAVGAGVFAVSRSALSLAVLAMVGAFMAPAFAVDDPGPGVVYGYYVAISVLTLGMVSMRGWRPLIHLSFLFTLAGSAFFAWTANYFVPANFAVMFPLLAMLVAAHVAMPLFERRWARGTVLDSLDTLYLLALPLVAALTALAIAPSRAGLAAQFWWFAAIWLAASAWLYSQKREGMATHAVIGLLMLGFGLAARFRNLPWELVTLAISVTALALAARRSESARLHGFLAGLVLVLAAVHMIGALAPAASSAIFLNERFVERLIGAGLLVIAALTLRRLRHSLDSLMLTVAIGWTAFALGAEIVRLDLVSAWFIVHWLLLFAGAAMYFVGPRNPASNRLVVPLVLCIGLSAVLAQLRTWVELSWLSALVSGAVLLALSLRPVSDEENSNSGRTLAAIAAPILVVLWIGRVAHLAHANWQFPLAVAAAGAMAVLLAAYRAEIRSARWFNEATDLFAVAFAFVLAAATVFDIERDAWAVVLELLCVSGLALAASWNGARVRVGHWIIPATVIGVALVLQANLLRWLGPPGDLNALDVAKMNWPTLVSLMWASIGAALTIWGRRIGSRVQWSAGAAFLVGAAIKLLLLDFGSLGQLANILAVIVAGGVFLLVGWLAPMPPPKPKAPESPQRVHDPRVSTATPPAGQWRAAPPKSSGDSSGKFAWTVSIVGIVLITLSQCGSRHGRDLRIERLSINDSIEVEDEEDRTAQAATLAAEATASNPDAAEDDAPQTAPMPSEAVAPVALPESACRRWVAKLPDEYEVHVLTAMGNLHADRARNLLVDLPGRNIVLVFGAAAPVDWTVSASAATGIAGVWMPDNVAQRLSGIPEEVPVLRASANLDPDCDMRAIAGGESSALQQVTRVFGREPASDTRMFEGWTRLKDAATTAAPVVQATAAVSNSPNRDPWKDERLMQLVNQGKLRRATMSDYERWRASGGPAPRRSVMEDPRESGSRERFLFQTYVVQGAMTIPDGLYGPHAVTFLVPRGAPRPTGNPGHSEILDMN